SMKRDVEKELIAWKKQDGRTPLIIRGARQVGKSFTVEKFGRANFQNTIVVNFEETPDAKSCFETLDVQSIIKQLELLYGQAITPGSTLVFLDEIQNCPQAIKALRYFKEKLQNLHVIAAGSLLEFVLEDEEMPISFPVGRVRFLTMKPLSFREFLCAIGQEQWEEYFETMTLQDSKSDGLHTQLLRFVRDYFLIGGMPAVVNAYLKSQSFLEVIREQKALLDVYRLDLAKYGQKREFAHLQKLFESCPHFVAKNFRYSKIDPESTNPSREYKNALRKLSQANIIAPVHATAANGIPLKAEENEKKFKLLFLDVGLLQCALEVDPSVFTQTAFQQVNSGVLAEQFTGQELLAYVDPYMDFHLFFWETEKQGSAEVDYLINYHGKIVPIEVKAGKSVRLTSLNQFMKLKPAPIGVHVSANVLSFKDRVLSVPFYLIKEIPRLLKTLEAG
ncbi:MAG: ATP-binding protein, partial [Chlamydiales bacterium]